MFFNLQLRINFFLVLLTVTGASSVLHNCLYYSLLSQTDKVSRSALCHSFSSLLKDLHGIIFFKTTAVPGTGRTTSGHAVLNAETSHHFLFAHGFIQRYVDKTKQKHIQINLEKQKEKFAHRGRDFYCISTYSLYI